MWRKEKKKACPFFLLENSRPLSPWGPLDSLSTCLGTDSLIIISSGLKEKKNYPFLLLENSRPLSPPQDPQTPFSSSGTLHFLSTYLGIDSLTAEQLSLCTTTIDPALLSLGATTTEARTPGARV